MDLWCLQVSLWNKVYSMKVAFLSEAAREGNPSVGSPKQSNATIKNW